MWIWKSDLEYWIEGIETQLDMLYKKSPDYEKSENYLKGKLFALKRLLKKKSPLN